MLRELKTLARESVVYGLTSVLARTLGFLLTPLFSHLLDPSQNGAITTLYSYIGFLAVLYGLGLDTAYLRLGRRDGKSDGAAFATALAVVLPAALVFTVALHAAAVPVARLIGLPAELADLVRYAAWILALDAAATVPFAELRGSHRAGTYAAIRLVSVALNLFLAWVFVARMGLGLRGVLLANLAASTAALAALAPVVAARVARPDPALLRGLLGFGLPLAAAAFASSLVQNVDRPILQKMTDLGVTGLYGVGYKLGVVMLIVATMFDQAWKPFILERAGRPDADRIIARVLTYFGALSCWAFLGVCFLLEPAARAPLLAGKSLIHPAFWPGLVVTPVVSLGYVFFGLYFVLLAPLMLDRRTGAIGAATWLGAAVNIGANLVLIPRLGMMGAAWATLAAYASMAFAACLLGRATRAVPYEWRKLALLAGWTAGLWWLSTTVGLSVRVLLLAAYPVGLLVSGFLGADEVAELKVLLSARRARPGSSAPDAG